MYTKIKCKNINQKLTYKNWSKQTEQAVLKSKEKTEETDSHLHTRPQLLYPLPWTEWPLGVQTVPTGVWDEDKVIRQARLTRKIYVFYR